MYVTIGHPLHTTHAHTQKRGQNKDEEQSWIIVSIENHSISSDDLRKSWTTRDTSVGRKGWSLDLFSCCCCCWKTDTVDLCLGSTLSHCPVLSPCPCICPSLLGGDGDDDHDGTERKNDDDAAAAAEEDDDDDTLGSGPGHPSSQGAASDPPTPPKASLERVELLEDVHGGMDSDADADDGSDVAAVAAGGDRSDAAAVDHASPEQETRSVADAGHDDDDHDDDGVDDERMVEQSSDALLMAVGAMDGGVADVEMAAVAVGEASAVNLQQEQ